VKINFCAELTHCSFLVAALKAVKPSLVGGRFHWLPCTLRRFERGDQDSDLTGLSGRWSSATSRVDARKNVREIWVHSK